MRTISSIIESIGIDRLTKTPNGYKGCCCINPNHSDRSPSMHINLEKGHVKCFACGAYNTLFTFLTNNGASFDEAIEFMFFDYKREKAQIEGLTEYALGRKIPKSMIDRGYTIGTLKHFNVGYDEFEHRITIPLRYNGILYGIQYRQHPKIFWATDGFNKDNFIYNYEPTEERVYVEGFTDNWMVWQNGTTNVSATLSATASEGQMELMRKHRRIYIAYDMDKAGWKGAFRLHRNLRNDVELKVIMFSVKDPGACSKEQWEKAYADAIDFTEFEVKFLMKNPELYEQIKNG